MNKFRDPKNNIIRKMLWLMILCHVTSFALASGIIPDAIELINDYMKQNSIDSREGTVPDFNDFDREFDFIIVGAGSSGCVMANRLSEIEEWEVLLLEAGSDETFITDIPILAAFGSLTQMNWDYNTEPVPGACLGLRGGVCPWPRGKVLGGCSVLNFMIYTRGHRQDYDDWAAMGNKGWSYDEVLPYFKKSENMGILDLMNSTYHGTGGYMDIQRSPFKSTLRNAFKIAGKELGYPYNDPNGEEVIGFSEIQATMRDGRRCSASKAFLEPVRNRKNLHISKKSTVLKILIDPKSKRAYGVEFIKRGKRFRVRARKEVILSAGTLASAQLLMVSGVGPADNLREVGVEPLVVLPVGDNLQDHISLTGITFLVSNPSWIVNDASASNPQSVVEYMSSGDGPLTLPGGALGLAFFRTNLAELRDPGNTRPDMEIVLGAASLGGDTAGVLRGMLGIPDSWWMSMYLSRTEAAARARRQSFGINPVLLRPASRGTLRLRSADFRVPPKLQPNYFQDPEDLYALREGAKFAVKVAETNAFKTFNTTLYTKPYPNCGHLIFRSDEYWECAIRHISNSLDHQVGTCKMGPDGDTTSVVNTRLAVRGLRGLRVADCSVAPLLPTGHTHALATMIAEKAADIIKQDWGVL